MNIFALHESTRACAQMHCDKHVVKMILESGQIMCTVHHKFPNKKMEYTIPYKPTHANHPCVLWTQSSLGNYIWLYNLTKHLNDEYRHRYNRTFNHKTWDAVKDLPYPSIPTTGMTPWARAMPDEYKIDIHEDRKQNVIESYRKYYILGKQSLLHYTNRERPYWMEQG